MKLLIIYGTRPEAIKFLPIIKKWPESELFVMFTGQHQELVNPIHDLFNIIPDFSGDAYLGSSLNNTISYTINMANSIIVKEQPDIVMVQGDTASAMAGGIAAFMNKIPLAHLEAGLRTHDMTAPWPEEYNRRVISLSTSMHFAPTLHSKSNLILEGIDDRSIHVVGNTIVDALGMVLPMLNKEAVNDNIATLGDIHPMVLATIHRRENFDKLHNVCDAIEEIAKIAHIAIPVHLNPNVKDIIYKRLGDNDNIHLLLPQDYLNFTYLMSLADVLLTDSGGVQEEAPFFNKRTIIMRDKTERPEGVEAGIASLVGTDTDKIIKSVVRALGQHEYPFRNPYGDGHATDRIIKALNGEKYESWLG